MCRAGLLVALLARVAAAFNLDTDHPLVWSGLHRNFGYKLELRKGPGDDGYRLVVASPSETPVTRGDICREDPCFECFVNTTKPCMAKHFTFADTTENITEGIFLRTSWSTEPTKCWFDYEEQHFKVTLPGSPNELRMWRGERHQPGSVHNMSWCVADLNGDGSEDLVLGSSLYSRQPGSEEGLVLVYFNENRVEPYQQVKEIEGEFRGGNFGRSVSCIGDMNSDEYQDFAVGAPGEDDRRGAVYIYHGNRSGPVLSQRILAANVDKDGKGIKGFGVSIFGGVDVDDNYFNDLAVGASDSGHVILLRARPVVRLHAVLQTKVLQLSDIVRRLPVSYSVSYSAANRHQQATVEVELWLQSGSLLCVTGTSISCGGEETTGKLYRKVTALRPNEPARETVRMTIQKGAMLPPGPIELTLHYKLMESSQQDFCKTCPVVDPSDPDEVTLKVNHTFSCGDHICLTDLRLHAEFIKIPIPRPAEKPRVVAMYYTVQNLGEPAFLAICSVQAPHHWVVANKDCWRERYAGTATLLECDMGTLNGTTGQWSLFLELEAVEIPADTHHLQFNISVTSLGEEKTPADNWQTLILQVPSTAEEVSTSATVQSGMNSGPESRHNFLPNAAANCVPSWTPVVSAIGSLVICAILIAAVVVIYKRRQACRRKNEEIYKMNQSVEPLYDVPDAVEEPAYSVANAFYESQE